jgi:hypothetical protein
VPSTARPSRTCATCDADRAARAQDVQEAFSARREGCGPMSLTELDPVGVLFGVLAVLVFRRLRHR